MSLKKNVSANFFAQGWIALMGLAFVPLYIKYLGMEAYGLVGIFTLLLAWLTLLDMGMTPTINREMARYTAGVHTAQSIRDLLRSLEVISFVLAFLVAITIWFCATWLSTHWLQAEKLPVEQVAQAISIMGLVVALRFIEGLYRGAIIGLQKQILLSTASAALATLRSGGAVLVLIWVAPNIEAFFLWQGLVSGISIIVFMIITYYNLPPILHFAKFSWVQLKSIWKFASGMMTVTFLSLLLMQVDKIILSRLLSLEMFGYYTLAGTVAAVIFQLSGPIDQAFYPRFTELVTQKEIPKLIDIYHRGAQLSSVMLVPAGLILVFFGENLLILWTGNTDLAHHVAPLLILLVLGNIFNGFMHFPFYLTLAYAWPRFAIRQNIIAVILMIPTTLWVAPRYGAIGVASMWTILNLGYVLIAIHFIHWRLLKSEKWYWYLYDIMFPILGALTVIAVFWRFQPIFISKWIELAWLIACGLCAVFASVLITPDIRKSVFNLFKKPNNIQRT